MTIKLDQAETMSHPTNRSLKCQNSPTRPSCRPSCTTLTCLGPPRRVEPPALSRFSMDLDRKARPPQAPAPRPTRRLQLATKPRQPDTGAGGLAPDENVCILTHWRPLPLLQGHRRRLLHPLQFWGGGKQPTRIVTAPVCLSPGPGDVRHGCLPGTVRRSLPAGAGGGAPHRVPFLIALFDLSVLPLKGSAAPPPRPVFLLLVGATCVCS